jgi:hypothetical protein
MLVPLFKCSYFCYISTGAGVAIHWTTGVQFLTGAMRLISLSLCHRVQTGPGAHPASYPMSTGGKAAWAWCWQITSTQSHTYLLTYLMVQDILWKADSHSVCQTIVCFLYGTRRFISVLKKARIWALYWASRIQFALSIPISLRYILTLSSHLRLGLPSDLFPSGLPTKTL